ncbi:MAG: pyridoxal-5-phosphate-dependent protein subunit beta [Bacteroidetes bacterium RIFOXYA12_FULL_35_11]|nr:MAG: pyridoxal-5-phosphate-dependent protein subunit beta [Bacteroidetes bacterium GWF2_35_48]OFY76828.1 MAG: pyridoxal-5-phosphate-dependent protein subunit beta [Bacteroidetes bacterium RIFOXYA12_FULL_35_11]OFY92712.1 MAG: pyridoxal-5-phosphate-dependent protein subunit beta [Bacteroidetes bacterium RIFOXYB2_FULL_35_7]OFZ00114.1 MAG: pyridoxal-5-phosphate-dependent protein subunit beta [Bacteroidetes bacterium RIFOXYC12_FULL_35_7]HBX50096.1 pyridoxal-5-phosphate-dependent protein subunit b
MAKKINSTSKQEVLKKTVARFREKGIILPTFAQMQNPKLIPEKIKNKLKNIGLWDLHPMNLFRITWHNEPKEKGGLYGNPNYLELPKELTGVDARIVMMLGKWFPTGAHKVGAAYGCLAPRLISGEFDPTYHKAVWPSTGNYCRGGAFDSYLMDVTAVAILPEEMSKERFDWLKEIKAEVIATPGCESNVKEIYDACWDIRRNRKDCVIFNQFDEFGNACWHYEVTGHAIEEVFKLVKGKNFAAYVSATGSAGTIAAGDYFRTKFPHIKVVASEALQCPTLLRNGFGGHRIEGIGDKHVPWIHNVKNTNMISAIDDEYCMRLLRLFNDNEGKKYLASLGIEKRIIDNLYQIGISGIANILSAIKAAKYYEYTSDDVIVTLATDSAEMYISRLAELNKERGKYNQLQAAKDMEKCMLGTTCDHIKDLTYDDQKMIHNLKYFTWVEQQGKTYEEINQLWYDRNFWSNIFKQPAKWDEQIREFNEMTGLLKKL